MNSKVLLFLPILLATILLISAEAASKDKDKKINTDGNHVHNIFTNNCPISSNMHFFFLLANRCPKPKIVVLH